MLWKKIQEWESLIIDFSLCSEGVNPREDSLGISLGNSHLRLREHPGARGHTCPPTGVIHILWPVERGYSFVLWDSDDGFSIQGRGGGAVLEAAPFGGLVFIFYLMATVLETCLQHRLLSCPGFRDEQVGWCLCSFSGTSFYHLVEHDSFWSTLGGGEGWRDAWMSFSYRKEACDKPGITSEMSAELPWAFWYLSLWKVL